MTATKKKLAVKAGAEKKPGAAASALTEADAEAKAIAERVARLGETLHVNLDLNVGELVDSAAQRMNTAAIHTVLAGVELLAAKAHAEHGDFAMCVKSAGISWRQANYAMSIARWLLNLSNSHTWANLIKIAAPTKLRELARLDPAELADMEAEHETDSEGLLAYSQRDLAAMVRKQKRATLDAQTSLMHANDALADAGGQAAWILRADEFQKQIAELRANIELRLEDFMETVERLPTPPAVVHGRRVKKHTGTVRHHLTDLLRSMEAANAACETALLRIEEDEE